MFSHLMDLLRIGKQGDYSIVEENLEKVLKPVSPNTDFIRSLEQQLQAQWGAIPRPALSQSSQTALLMIVGVLSGVIVVVIAVRMAVILLTAIGVLRHLRNETATS